ncbi:MAG: hypothetical protein E7620_03800 [Ruminococcaceae bacterium]|nr:hypothetical protein [Oscillospiraceae bacterium]
MKIYNKILAVILSLVMLLSVVPLSVFADASAPVGNSQQNGSQQNGLTVTLTDPAQKGTGADGTITFTLDPSEVLAALKGEKTAEALIALLKECIDRSNTEVVNMNDLMEMVPFKAILTALLGENNENASNLVKQFGGIQALLDLVDEERLILTANQEQLADFLNSLENLSEIFVIDKVAELLPEKVEALENAAITAISAKFESGELTFGKDNFKDGKYKDAVLDAINAAGKNLSDYFPSEAEIMANQALVSEIVNTLIAEINNANLESKTPAEKLEYLQSILVDSAVTALINGEKTVEQLVAADVKTEKKTAILNALLENENSEVYRYAEANLNEVKFEQECGETLKSMLIADAKSAILSANHDSATYLKADFIASLAALVESDAMGSFTILSADVDAILAKVRAGECALGEVVRLSVFFAGLTEEDYSTIFAMMDMNVLAEELSDDTNFIVSKLTKEQLKTLVTQMLSVLVQNVKNIEIDGYQIAGVAGDNSELAGLLTPNYRGLAQAVAKLMPTLTEIADCEDGKLLSFNLFVEYEKVNYDRCSEDCEDESCEACKALRQATKDINIEFVFEGNLAPLRKLAGKLAEYISIKKVGNQLYVELTLPAIITEAYAKFLESEEGASIRDSVLGLAGKTGAELAEALKNLSLDQVIELLSKINVEELYSRIMQLSQIEAALEKICDVLDLDIDISKLQDLNAVLDAIANGVPTFEAVCNAISRRIGMDVMAILSTAASYADRNQTIQSYLDKLAEVPYIGKYIDDKSFSEILEKYKDVEPVKAVSDFIARKVDVNIQYLLQNYDANELYQLALEKAKDYEHYYNKVKNFILHALDPNFVATTIPEKLAQTLIPDGALNAFLNSSLLNVYTGNGSFTFEDDNIDVDLGAWSETILNFALKYIDVSEQTENLIRALLPNATVNFGLHLTVNFKNLSRVTYVDRDGNELFTTFLPNGVNPNEYQDAPVVEFEEFEFWVDANGTSNDAITAINGDVTLEPFYSREEYTVTFTGEGGVLGSFTVKNGMTLADITVPTPPTAEELGYYNGTYVYVWMLGETEMTPEQILSTQVLKDLTFTYVYSFVEGSEFVNGEDAEVEKDENDNWTVTFPEDQVELVIDRTKGDIADINTITVTTKDGVVISLDENVLKQIADGSNENSVIKLSYKQAAASGSYKHELFTYNPTNSYVFHLTVDNNDFFAQDGLTFNGDVEITIPFAGALKTDDQTQKTMLYLLLENGKVQEIAATVTEGVGLTFKAPHFSEFFIVNEYLLNVTFNGVNGSTAFDGGVMIPENAEVHNIIPTITNNAGKVISTINLLKTADNSLWNTIAKIGDGIDAMPAFALTVEFKAEDIPATAKYRVVYEENGTAKEALFDTEAEANKFLADNAAKIKVPFGYRLANAWVGESQANGVIYYVPKTEAIQVTLTFPGNVVVEFTVETYNSFYIPGITESAGYTVEWECKDLNLILSSNTKAEDLLKAMLDANKTSVAVTEKKTAVSYTVQLPEGVTLPENIANSFHKDATVEVVITLKEGYELVSLKWFGDSANGEITKNADGKYTFTMPASNVRVELEQKASDVTIEIAGQNVTTQYGKTITFTVTIPAGEILESAPALGKLVTFVVNSDGSKTLTYALNVTVEIKDGTKISYKTAPKLPTVITLSNALVTTEQAPAASIEGLVFAGFAAPESAKLNNTEYQFAIFNQIDEPANLLWLWITLALIALIVLITVLYRLYIGGRFKPNFFLRFITWIVQMFFYVCLAVSGLVLKIAQGTTKREDINFEAFGLENPDED